VDQGIQMGNLIAISCAPNDIIGRCSAMLVAAKRVERSDCPGEAEQAGDAIPEYAEGCLSCKL
jgi:hypothetical protein